MFDVNKMFKKQIDFERKRNEEAKDYPPLLSPVEILEKLKSGEIKFDFMGHDGGNPNDDFQFDFTEHFSEILVDSLSFNLEYYTELENDNIKDWEGYRQRSLDFLNKKIPKGERIAYGLNSSEFDCEKCGKRFYFCLKDENTITLYPGFHMIEEENTDCQCEYSGGVSPLTLEIEMETGNFIIGNFFPDKDKILEIPNKNCRKDSINHFSGRRKRAKHLAENFNVLYGQMGNMSVEVWANEDNSEILITNRYFDDYEDYSYDEKEIEDFKALKKKIEDEKFTSRGDLCLEVWCWEAADKAFLEKNNLPLDTNGNEHISIEGKPGKWEFTHFYDTTSPSDALYSVIKKL